MDLNSFIAQIPEFENMEPSKQIDYFAYYLTTIKKQDGFLAKEILECFNTLHLRPYSNIPSYLSKYSQRSSNQKFLKRKNFYFIENKTQKNIQSTIDSDYSKDPSNNLYPISIFENTRGYLIALAKEAAACYDSRLYNSCFFMIRKIIEVLIIDIYEKHRIDSKIKNESGNYLMLSDLLNKLSSEKTWTLSKLAKQEIPKIKKMADSSVHNKLFSAKKPDLENIKTDLRIILQELINMVDYPNWK